MAAQQKNHDFTKISLSELTIGMYVISLIKPRNDVCVKSEGYISQEKTIEKIRKSGVKFVLIDPSKTKQDAAEPPKIQEKIDEPKELNSTTPLDHEIHSAYSLYNNAKTLQNKVIASIAEDRQIDLDEINKTSTAIVDSIFRNQDALSCMTLLRMKDEYLVEHSLNVAVLMSIFAKHLGFERELIEQLALGAFLHDVGKVLVPNEILNKPGKLTSDEYEIMKKHVDYGINVVSELAHFPKPALDIISQHHERIDGSGYPKKTTDKQISQYGRMIAIVDSYDAMTSERVYKAGMQPIKAFKLLMNETESAYDVALLEEFIKCIGIYPVGTLVKLSSGKLGIICQLNKSRPLHPVVRIFYNTRLNQAIEIKDIDLSQAKHNDQIESSIKPEEFKIDLMKFFQTAFL